MEVPDWGDAPDQDYPSFDQPIQLPGTSNARKKAKRKRKQQQEQQEAQLNVPVRLGKQQRQPDVDAEVIKKLRTHSEVPAKDGIAAPTSQMHERDREQKRNAKQLLNATQDRRDRRRAAIHEEDMETTIRSAAQPEEGLSTADMAQLLELAQLAKKHNPDLQGEPHVTLSEGASSSAKVSKHKTSKSTAVSNVPDVPAAQATQPIAKPVKKASRGLPGAVGATKPKAQKHPPAQATDAPAPAPASGAVALTSKVVTAENGVSDAGKVKSSKLGRKARLRLKRQLWRQKQEESQQAQQQEPNGNEGSHHLAAADSDTAVKGPQSDAAAKKKQTKAQKPKEARTAVIAPGQSTAVSRKQLQDDKPDGLAAAAAAAAAAALAAGGPAKGAKKQNSKQAAAASPAEALAQEATDQAADKSSKGSKQLKAQGGPAAGLTAAAAEHIAAAQKKGKAGLLDQMRSKLSGGRFRMLNEQLYTAPGQDAFEMMQGDPALFEQYHEGFREQTQHWPVQPIDLAIAWLKKKSPAWVAADFGCGDAQLASSVPQTVHSFDLVATAPGVTACNMADVPLGDASVHAAIFCLALMGTDYGAFLQEAHRVLRPGGLLWIAEVRSRFARADGASTQGRQNDFAEFVAALKAQGFHITQQEASNKMFVVFVAKKAQQTGSKVQWPVLKPCLYKRR